MSQEIAQFCGHGGSEHEGPAIARMEEAQESRMQSKPARIAAVSVNRIPIHRSAKMRQMDSDLVGTSGFQPALHKRAPCSAAASQHSIVRNGVLASKRYGSLPADVSR